MSGLDGMEEESTPVKNAYLEALKYNGEHKVLNISSYENTLKSQVLAAGSEESKMEIISGSKQDLEQARTENEIMFMI